MKVHARVKTYLTKWLSSEGAGPVEVVERLCSWGACATLEVGLQL